MKAHVERQFVRVVENEFNRIYPFLKIEFEKNGNIRPDAADLEGPDYDILRKRARHLLLEELNITDAMKVSDLETALHQVFGNAVQVFRKGGNFWIGTRMTREWTLKQQNDHGRELI